MQFYKDEQRLRVDAVLGEQATRIAHDIKSPVVALKLCLQIAKIELREDYKELINNSITRIDSIAEKLLLSHRESMSEDLKTKAMLCEVVQTCINEKRAMFPSVRLKFDVTSEDCGLFSLIDCIDYERAISNLLNDAIEAVKDRDGEVEIFITYQLNKIQIVIADNGSGIPSEVLERLRSGQQITMGKRHGNGIGLLQSIRIIESNGGSIKIDSEPTRGTSVLIANYVRISVIPDSRFGHPGQLGRASRSVATS